MTYTPERFNQQLNVLTDPVHGVVAPTGIPDIYGLTGREVATDSELPGIIVITGPSCVGKDSIIENMLGTDARFQRARTATTRSRRPEESAASMTWMRTQRPDESYEEYSVNLVGEYDLAEYSLHHGDIYGLPKQNLTSIAADKIPLLNTDTEGIASLRKSLAGEYILASIMVCPESAEQLEERMRAVQRYSWARMETALGYLEAAPDTADFILVNRESDQPHQAVAEYSARVCQLLGDVGLI